LGKGKRAGSWGKWPREQGKTGGWGKRGQGGRQGDGRGTAEGMAEGTAEGTYIEYPPQ